MTSSRRGDSRAAMLFLLPNFLGFLLFVSFPLIFSLAMAFTSWSIPNDNFRFVGVQNFRDLLADGSFWFYFANTGYFMIGIPVGIGGSLLLAVALSQPINIRSWRWRGGISLIMLALAAIVLGMGKAAYCGDAPEWVILAAGLTAGIGLVAVWGGAVAFRTLFYLPSFTSGVAMMILWKKLYRADSGPINQGIQISLDGLVSLSQSVPSWVFFGLAVLVSLGLLSLFLRLALRAIREEFNRAELAIGLLLIVAAVLFALLRIRPELWFLAVPGAVLIAGAAGATVKFLVGREFDRVSPSFFSALLGIGGWAVLLCCIGAFLWAMPHLPAWQLSPPQWLASPRNLLGYDLQSGHLVITANSFGIGAREAIILMGLWTGLGGNTMLLYLAALSNVPPELYEAADIDGAGRWAKFRHVTWPQVAPTTFFIVVMATIGGMQGGFEQARVMTGGGPAETTITLSYYIYNRAFERFQLGYASAVSWFLFLVIFVLTLVNWRFGNRAMNE